MPSRLNTSLRISPVALGRIALGRIALGRIALGFVASVTSVAPTAFAFGATDTPTGQSASTMDPVPQQRVAPTMEADPTELLAGPRVQEPAQRATLVHRSFDGTLERISDGPEERALALVGLDPDAREALDRLIGERNVEFDALARTFYGVLEDDGNEGGMRMNGGSPQERLTAMRRARAHFEPALRRGSLIEEMTPHLSEVQRLEAQRLVREYVDALVSERLSDPDSRTGRRWSTRAPAPPPPTPALDGPHEAAEKDAQRNVHAHVAPGKDADDPPTRRLGTRLGDRLAGRPPAPEIQARRAVQLEILGQRIRESIQRQAGQATMIFDSFAAELELSPEQADRLKAILQPLATARLTGRPPEPEVVAEVLAEASRVLTPAQRATARQMLRR